jgi:4-hydroxybenzoate polyprenyltransferase
MYIINDILDKERDKFHPIKKLRPIASGSVSIIEGFIISFILLILSIFTASTLPQTFYLIILAYLFLQIIYTLSLKNFVILDGISIALGFILRILGGGVAIDVPISSWLFLCTFFLALFLAFCKRRAEMELENYSDQRQVLEKYSKTFLDHLISISAGITVLCYSLYIISPETIKKFHSPYLILTLPFVVYGIYRYLYLVHIKNIGEEPSSVLFKDKPFLLNILLWIIIFFAILYEGKI